MAARKWTMPGAELVTGAKALEINTPLAAEPTDLIVYAGSVVEATQITAVVPALRSALMKDEPWFWFMPISIPLSPLKAATYEERSGAVVGTGTSLTTLRLNGAR